MRRDNDRFKQFSRRAALLGGAQALLMSALIGRMYYLQVVERDQYRLLADENRIDLQLLAPPRGRILDRFGNLLAGNRQNYQVLLVAEQAKDIDETLTRLARLIPISEGEYARVRRELSRKRDFVPVRVRENLSWEQFANVNVNTPDLPGIQPEIGESRFYPAGPAFAHLTGYVGAVAEEDQTGDPLLELPGFRIGKGGIERNFDKRLRGTAGSSRVEVNALGRVIRELQRDDGRPGEDLVTTVDAELQTYAAARLGEESAAAVVLDVHSGEVLALASTPSFDPNLFAQGISRTDWRALVNHPRHPLVNKAVAGQYPPGSTFKLAVALAALEAGVARATTTATCYGRVKLGRATFHCWKRGGHGTLDMPSAIQQSCDVYFYELAQKVGIDRLAEMARRLGFGARTGIELPGEQPGLMPDKAWKLALFGVPWQQGETLVTGIGQGFVSSTPLQLALMTARIANGGYAVTPTLVRAAPRPSAGRGARDAHPTEPPAAPASAPALGLAPSSLRLVTEAMNLVSNSPRGTAYRSRIEEAEWALAGKTGTSQVRRISEAERDSGVLKNDERPWDQRDHALFVAFAPVAAPRYAISVVVEHGGSGSSAAAPIARDILIRAQLLAAKQRGLATGSPVSRAEGA